MDVNELFEEHREHINQAQIALSLCDYEHSVFCLCLAHGSSVELLKLVSSMSLEARKAVRPAGEVPG